MQNTAEYYCASFCEPNLPFIYISQGFQQSYIEDCQVCYRSNILYIRIDEDTIEIEINKD